ncbi:PREDICTED: grpE protein homolog 1, mitochondrial-like isoform X2 [Priapulus caudatus]|uniref:GrpE protein homolog n=1 Tax=Priapulus caudatus TaxID=37621 RepID=A0ABM1FAM7_PRICU|nr:PREDICTED: grpE protein homolog 1, mitochondrial-like isoform X2 [Priapulus caudatus]
MDMSQCIQATSYSTTQHDEKGSEGTQTSNIPETGGEGAATCHGEKAVLVEELEKSFQVEKEKLVAEVKDIDDKYKRTLAEVQNVRQRMQRQIDDSKVFSIQGFCKDLLEVADILGKATESVPQEELTDNNPHLKNLYDGLLMTDGQLHKVFSKNGLARITPDVGEKFDPNIHEAMFQIPSENIAVGNIAVVVKVGYSLHSRTLRAAVVGVAKAP